MMYVALLRGINVGGNTKIAMPQLKTCFEELDFTNVKTYINSGNVIFETRAQSAPKLCAAIEKSIETSFGLAVPVIVMTQAEINKILAEVPTDWVNSSDEKTDVMFLWDHVDLTSVLDQLKPNPDLETLKVLPRALVWNVMRKNVTKSKILKMIGTPLYKSMTVRNINTVRKLAALMK